MSRNLSRRRLLRGAGHIAIGLPFLEAFASRNGNAQEDTAPKRLVVMFSGGCGTVQSAWRPTGTGTNFTLSPILQPLQPHQSDLVVLSGIHNASCNTQGNADLHTRGITHMLTNEHLIEMPELDACCGVRGYAGGPSIDQVAADHVGDATRFRSLEFGVMTESFWGAHPNSRMSYAGPADPVPAEDDPNDAFARIFSDLGTDAAELEIIRAQRRSVLDYVLEDFEDVNSVVGAEDRMRLEAHMDRIRQIEENLDFVPEAECPIPPMPDFPNPHNNNQYGAIGQAQTELLVAALACDQTRVATLQWSHGQSEVHHGWLGGDAGHTHHYLSHQSDPGSISSLVEIGEWYSGRLASMLELMKAVDEGEGTMLDNTLVVWANEMGEGQHTYENTPWLLAGSCGGAIETGQHIDYGGQPHGRLLVSVLNAMDVNVQSFGMPELSNGPLTEFLT